MTYSTMILYFDDNPRDQRTVSEQLELDAIHAIPLVGKKRGQ